MQGQRPILIGSFKVTGLESSNLILDGLMLDALDTADNVSQNQNIITVQPGSLKTIVVRHCTILPRMYLFCWDNVPEFESYRLINLLKRIFSQVKNWIDTANIIRSSDGSSITISSSDAQHSLVIQLELNNAKARLIIDSNPIAEFVAVKENGKINIYVDRTSLQVNGYNDDLNVILDKTICGRITTIRSLPLAWTDIQPNSTDSQNLAKFLKQNSQDLDWIDGTQTIANSFDTIAITSADTKHSVLISDIGGNTQIKIDGKETNEFELRYQENMYQLWTKSEAKLQITDSVVDGKGDDFAINSHASTIQNSTIFGQVSVELMEQASNSIFTGIVLAQRRQQGCIRYCYLPSGSKVPPCYNCLSDTIPSNNSQKIRTVPFFTSEKYGDPGYAQLHKNIAKEIFEGADNEQEMGVFNYLYQPQRIKDLVFSLDEYMRFGMEAGVFLET